MLNTNDLILYLDIHIFLPILYLFYIILYNTISILIKLHNNINQNNNNINQIYFMSCIIIYLLEGCLKEFNENLKVLNYFSIAMRKAWLKF